MSLSDYRRNKLSTLTNNIGVYVLCDLDKVPIYVGQSTDGIRSRVQRHLTSARSDVIANRQLDIWEVAWVLGYPTTTKTQIQPLENYLITQHDNNKPLMQAAIPAPVNSLSFTLPTKQEVQILPDDLIAQRKQPAYRLPRQAWFFHTLVDYILEVKDNEAQRRTLRAHHERLVDYTNSFLNS